MIDILMATYNGEKYIDLQLFSIVNQTYKEWNLYIHDDGSTDNTIKIIKDWQEKDSRIHLVDDQITHLGAGNNFFHLLPCSNADYVCFCDQDDFWFENKLYEYVSFMEKLDNTKPQCLFSSAYIWNDNSITPFLHEKPETLSSILFTGGTQGCSLVFNKSLKNTVQKLVSKSIFLHDYVIVFTAILFGKMHYSNKKLMLYRQHSQNVTEHMPKTFHEKIIRALTVNKYKSFIYPHVYDDIKTFFETFENDFSEEQKVAINNYLELPKLNKGKRLIKIIFSDYKIGQHSHFSFIIKYLLRKNYL